MVEEDPIRSIGFLLHDAARLLGRNFDRRSRGRGLTRGQWSVLARLVDNEGLRQTVLADILEIEPITLCRLIDKLEASGWVERRHDPSDRRARKLYLTPQALPLIEEMRSHAAATTEDALAGLSATQRQVLKELLVQVRANLSATDEPAPAPEV